MTKVIQEAEDEPANEDAKNDSPGCQTAVDSQHGLMVLRYSIAGLTVPGKVFPACVSVARRQCLSRVSGVVIIDFPLEAFDTAFKMLPLLCRALAFGQIQNKMDFLRHGGRSSG